MELTDVPGVITQLDDFREALVWRHTGKPHAGIFKPLTVIYIYLKTMAMTLVDFTFTAVDIGYLLPGSTRQG